MRLLNCLFFSLVVLLSPLTVNGQEPRAGQLREMLKTGVFDVGLLLQTEINFSFDDDDFNGGRGFDLGATRLDVRGNIDESYSYRFQVDFRNQVSIMDAQVGYRHSDLLTLVAGAFKPLTSIDLDPNPGDTDFINRARHVGAMMNSREIGLTVMGESGNFNYFTGIYNGTGLSREIDNRFMYTTRFAYTMDLDGGGLDFGVNLFLDQSRNSNVGRSGLASEKDRYLYGGFVQFHKQSFFGTVEFLETRFNAVELAGSETITGFFATLGVKVSPENEILARWDYLAYDSRGQRSDLFVLGWNHQATSLISFQLNLLGEFNDFTDNHFGVSGLAQFQF